MNTTGPDDRQLKATAAALYLVRDATGHDPCQTVASLGCMLEVTLNKIDNDRKREVVTMHFIKQLCDRMGIGCSEVGTR